LPIVSIDLADRKRAAVVTDHDSHVLGRRRVTARVWEARRPAGLRPMVCVQPLLVYRTREGEDLAFDKSDPKDALIIARLAAGLPSWATLVRTRAPDQVPGADDVLRRDDGSPVTLEVIPVGVQHYRPDPQAAPARLTATWALATWPDD
jgi:hypothetical protein